MYGHQISLYLKDKLPEALNKEIIKRRKLSSTITSQEYNKHIEDTFLYINYKITNEINIDTSYSGSTCISLIYTPEKLICANVGDSRCVLGKYFSGGNIIVNCSVDFSKFIKRP